MTLTYEPLAPNEPVKFKLRGFPEEAAVRSALEGFYAKNPDADRRFSVDNMFQELIFSGSVDGEGRVLEIRAHDRPRENFKKPN
jgi:hypothetical protein